MAKPPKTSSPFAPETAADYPVGYGKPPKASRFQKGQSGNPGGASRKIRARKSDAHGSPFDQIILKAARRKMAITENGVRSEITTYEAVIRKMAIGAAKGEPSATRRYIDQVESAQDRELTGRMARFGLLAQYVQEHTAARGSKVVDPLPAWPSADDVVLDYFNCRGEVLGPVDAHQAEPFIALVEDYRIWKARLAQLRMMANQAAEASLSFYQSAVGSVEAFLATLRRHMPPSFATQLGQHDGDLSTEVLEVPNSDGGTINLALLSLDDDGDGALHVLSERAENLRRDISRRAKLNIAANTASLINRLQIERQNRDGGAPPIQAAPDFDQFYDGFAEGPGIDEVPAP